MKVEVRQIERDPMRDLILASAGGTIGEAEGKNFEECLRLSHHLWLGYIDGVLVGGWGLAPPTLISNKAYLWLYSTPEVDSYKFLFVRWSQRCMEQMLELYPEIVGVTAVGAHRSIRWLTWLGAEFFSAVDGHIPFVIRKKTNG